MDPGDYGPFVNVVALASALVATFSMLLLKMLGRLRQWTWLAGGAPSFLVTAGARMLAVAIMALTYVTIDTSNYVWFAIAAVVCGVLGFVFVARFERLSKQHVWKIPLVGADGRQLADRTRKPLYQAVVVGREADLKAVAKKDFEKAQKKRAGLSLAQFMSGYGAGTVNDPASLWDGDLLARVSSKLTITLMFVVLLGVMALFLAALVLDAASRPG